MNLVKFIRQRAGRPIRAASINGPQESAECFSRLTIAPPLALQNTPLGPLLSYQGPVEVWAQLTAPVVLGQAAGPFLWTELVEADGGGWSDGALSDQGGQSPAYNSIGGINLTLPAIVRLRLTGVNDWRFTLGTC